ncbi:MAG: SAM-dependent methyltransferase [Bacteroidetes bacterium B1(2017)]|nr:MAG: SAM-dependent methyltransferase [Bacteroidetes bacterium B1(2017)]
MPTLNGIYWENRYQQGDTGWDIGSASTPILSYCEQIPDKNLSILIPGCGNGYEAESLLQLGFTNITLIDLAESPLNEFRKRNELAVFEGKIKLICTDFFEHQGQYDLILEQTFFCAIHPAQRDDYASKMNSLLVPNGKLAGLLFNFPLSQEGPPFGGSMPNYLQHFGPWFSIKTLENCYNSIAPRAGRELFFILQKPA